MNIQKDTFNNFDSFKEVITDWSLDFTILSKGDFKANSSTIAEMYNF